MKSLLFILPSKAPFHGELVTYERIYYFMEKASEATLSSWKIVTWHVWTENFKDFDSDLWPLFFQPPILDLINMPTVFHRIKSN